ncbi:TerC family protein [Ureibacillus thermophilus]|uniref:TerC family protein n=1 Tax=Ureibacillus thermophilus TaxID=367743 RepID=A0A4P6USL6_9BACL|nr:TerC family protein [Ureibacillus thermophilus]QBK26319.1 TerC family protein [Ureibacillus thermophilus]
MEMMSFEFFTALLSIIFIDLVLAGDNALLIGMVAKNLPTKQQKKVIVVGTLAAIFMRILFTIMAVKLLEIDGLLFIGGVLLVYIALKLLATEESNDIRPSAKSFLGAVWTIMLADFLMGIDNIMAVAGASSGNMLLVAIGLFISIPIIVWGSTIVIGIIERFPLFIYLGAAVLAWTASKMMIKDAYVQPYLTNPLPIILFQLLLIFIVVFIGYLLRSRDKGKSHQFE